MEKIIEDDLFGRVVWDQYWWQTRCRFEPLGTEIEVILETDEGVDIERIPEAFKREYMAFRDGFKALEPQILDGLYTFYLEEGRDWGVGEFEHGIFIFSGLDQALKQNEGLDLQMTESYMQDRGGGIGDIAPLLEKPADIRRLVRLDTVAISPIYGQGYQPDPHRAKLVLGYKCTWDSENVGIRLLDTRIDEIARGRYVGAH